MMLPRNLESPPPKELDKVLREFSDSVRAPDDFIDEGIRLCERVRVKLQQEVSRSNVSYSIAENRYDGSVGKHTDVGAPDFDLVFFINNHLTPFDDVVEHFRKILLEHSAELEIRPESIRKTNLNHAVQFKFLNKMEVDLLPATADLTEKQIRRKLKKIQKKKGFSNKEWRRLSSSVTDNQVNFMKVQSGFAHRVVRLAKHWLKSLHFPEKVPSVIFELLGVEAAMATEGLGGEPMLRAITRVVEKVEEIDKIKLAFKKDSDGNWRVMEGGDLLPGGQGQVSGIHGKNFIIEPSIHANNLLRKVKPEIKQLFKDYARIMMSRLQNFKSGRIGVGQAFEPVVLQPKPVQNVVPLVTPFQSVAHVVQAFAKKKFLKKPGLIIRNKKMVTPEQKQEAEMLMNQLESVVGNVIGTGGYNIETKAGRRVRYKLMINSAMAAVETKFPEMMVTTLGVPARMKDFDMVISVPYMTADIEGICIMVGLRWGKEA